jgi:hypothetical protein
MEHDFEKLRAERNKSVRKHLETLANEHGVKIDKVQTTFNPNACYCACGTGGPCEHKWDGPVWQGDSFATVTCSRCGCSAMSHDMRG